MQFTNIHIVLFLAGLVLFFSLPRHIFGKVQRCLFPKYFMCNSLLSAITLALFILHHPSTAKGELRVQVQCTTSHNHSILMRLMAEGRLKGNLK